MGIVILFIFIIFPVSLLVGAICSFGGVEFIYRLRGVSKKKRRISLGVKIGLTLLFAFIFVILTYIIIIFEETKTEHDYWKYQGLRDLWRMPLEYPYELVMADKLDNALIGIWKYAEEATGTAPISGISKYYKKEQIIVGEICRHSEDKNKKWFSFNCGNGIGVEYKNKKEYLGAIKKLGFEKEPKLLTVRENWNRYWSAEIGERP